MGMRMEDLPRHAQEKIRAAEAKTKTAGGGTGATGREPMSRTVVRPPAVAGWVRLVFLGEPPTVTHQDKVIGRNFRTGRANLRDSQELSDAREALMAGLPHNTTGQVLAGPIEMSLRIVWPGEFGWYEQKPDLDNAVKTLVDVLVARGWIADDKAIVRFANVEKTRGVKPGMWIQLITIYRKPHTMDFDDPQSPGVIHPLKNFEPGLIGPCGGETGPVPSEIGGNRPESVDQKRSEVWVKMNEIPTHAEQDLSDESDQT